MSTKDNGSKGSRVGGRMNPRSPQGNRQPDPGQPGPSESMTAVPTRLPTVPAFVSGKRPLQEKLFKTDVAESYTRIQLAIKALPRNVEDAEWRSSIDVHNALLPYKHDGQAPEPEVLPLPWLDAEHAPQPEQDDKQR
ncbi:MAG: hypothetical protein ACO3PV_04960 [Pseudohongiellaceae bacterium]